jgi:Ras-related protein Rab-5C
MSPRLAIGDFLRSDIQAHSAHDKRQFNFFFFFFFLSIDRLKSRNFKMPPKRDETLPIALPSLLSIVCYTVSQNAREKSFSGEISDKKKTRNMSSSRSSRLPHQLKVITLGDSGCGKTTMCHWLTTHEWKSDTVSTIGVAYVKASVATNQGQKLTLSIWDTSGNCKYKALGSIYYRDAHGALIVYDVTHRKSFERATEWIETLREMSPGGQLPCSVLVANKVDLCEPPDGDRGARQVAADEGAEMAQRFGMQFFETSAKSGQNIANAFEAIATAIAASDAPARRRSSLNNSIADESSPLVSQPPSQGAPSESSCC